MLSKLAKRLVIAESGFVFQTALAEIILLIVLAYIAKLTVLPAIRSYKLARKLDAVANSNVKRHWFYGHIQKFGKSPYERLTALAKLTSTIPTMLNFWKGPLMSIAILFHPDLAQPFFSSGAPKNDASYGYLRSWIGDGLLTSNGKKWKRNRQLLTPAFHFTILKPYMVVSNNTSKIMIEKWKRKTGQPYNISNDVCMMTLDTMVQCAMSTKTNCQLGDGQHPYIKAINEITRCLMMRLANPLYHMEWIFKFSTVGRKYYKSVDTVHKQAEELIAKRRKALDEKGSEEEKTSQDKKKMYDFLDILLQTRDDEGKGLTDQEIRDEVDTFLFEGHDTTSSGIQWALYNFAKHPQIQETCREEIQSVVGAKDDIEWDDLGKLPYLTMCIKESLRLYPPVLSVSRKLTKPLLTKSKLNNPEQNVIPIGSAVALNIHAMHHNKHLWENPNEFIPERFTKENCAKRQLHSYVPFSAGPRNCIGQNFAMNEMKVALTQILRSFRLFLDGDVPEPEMEIRIILQSRNGIFIKLAPL